MNRRVRRLMVVVTAWAVSTIGGMAPAAAQVQQVIYIIDKPTAGILNDGAYLLRARLGPESSFLASIRIGFRERFQIGTSFGMQRIFERGDPEFNNQVGFQVRLRLLDELEAPALAVGFDSQGLGEYHAADDLERYDRKSPGFYVVLSKNYALVAGELSAHGGVSWSTEREDDGDPNVFAGADWLLFEHLSFLLDVDAALNDDTDNPDFGRGGIYIDAGIRWFYGESLVMTLIFRDLSGNFGRSRSVGREFELALIDFF
ncbi:MAG: hypothetical protein V3V49_03630 [Candidatus Krumholzibacteria bacterium]